MATDDQVWEIVKSLMPDCPTCATQLQPGGIPAAGIHMLVCTGCSWMGQVEPEWVGAKVDEARALAEAGAN